MYPLVFPFEANGLAFHSQAMQLSLYSANIRYMVERVLLTKLEPPVFHINKYIIIRSILNYKKRAEISAASGVVIDSKPKREYKENYIKAKSLLDLFKT